MVRELKHVGGTLVLCQRIALQIDRAVADVGDLDPVCRSAVFIDGGAVAMTFLIF
jgi:hypothetical protein